MPIKYIPFFPDTVEGQAILNNVTRTRRTLKYRDNTAVYETLRRGMPFYEVDSIETVRAKDSSQERRNLLVRGECISACAYLKEKGVLIDLVYIDPPFASGADYAKKVFIRRNPHVAELMAKAREEMEINEVRSFEEKMYGDIWNKEDYLNWMYENLMAIKSVMSETSSIYVHLDWNIVHYMKVLLDEIFPGYDFSEIIWVCGLMGAGPVFPKSHETLLFYKNEHSFFSPPARKGYGDYVRKSIQKDDDGWYYTRRQESSGGKNFLKTYISTNPLLSKEEALEEASRKRPQPAWSAWIGKDDVAELFNNDYGIGTYAFTEDENVGYTTQKPEALLRRIIQASSDAGMTVADFFGGGGVTAKVAHDLGRQFIHVDVGMNSIQTTRDRLVAANAGFEVLDIRDGVNLFRNPVQTMEKLGTLIPGLQRNVGGLSSFWFGAIQDSDAGMVPVYVPNLLNHKEKVLDTTTINILINRELPELESAKRVVVYYIDIANEDGLYRFIKENNRTMTEIELRDLKHVLDETVITDIVRYKLENQGNKFELEITNFLSDRLRQKIDEYNQKHSLQMKYGSPAENGEDNTNGDSQREKRTATSKSASIEISDQGLELIEFVSLDCTNTEGAWKSDKEIRLDKLGYVIEDGKKTKRLWDAKIRSDKKPLRLKLRNIAGDEVIVAVE